MTTGLAETLAKIREQGFLDSSHTPIAPRNPLETRIQAAASDAMNYLPLPAESNGPPVSSAPNKKHPRDASPARDATPPSREDPRSTPPTKRTIVAISPAVPEEKMPTPDREIAQQQVTSPDNSHNPEFWNRDKNGNLTRNARKALKRAKKLSTKTIIVGQSPLKDVKQIKSHAVAPSHAGVFSIPSSTGALRYWTLHRNIDQPSVIPIKGPGLLPLAGPDLVSLSEMHSLLNPGKPFREFLEERVSPIPQRSPTPSSSAGPSPSSAGPSPSSSSSSSSSADPSPLLPEDSL